MDIYAPPQTCFSGHGSCSRLSLLYCLLGFLTLLLPDWKPFYFAGVLALLVGLGTALEKGLPLGFAILYLVLGAALGLEARLLLQKPWHGSKRQALTPTLLASSKAQHKHSTVLFFANLLALVLVFPFVDASIPDTGFNYGVWLALLGFLLWWGAVFFINLQKVPGSGGVKPASLEERSLVLSYMLVLATGLSLFVPAVISPLSTPIFTGLGVGLAAVVNALLTQSKAWRQDCSGRPRRVYLLFVGVFLFHACKHTGLGGGFAGKSQVSC